MAIIAPTPVTAGPAVPDSADPEITFDAQYEAFNTWEKNNLQPEINALATIIVGVVTTIVVLSGIWMMRQEKRRQREIAQAAKEITG